VTAIEDAFDVALAFDGPEGHGLRYECHATMIAADAAPRFRVNGTLGSYVKFGLDPQEAALLRGDRPKAVGSAEAWLPEVESAWGTLTLATQAKEPIQLEQSKLPTEVGDYRKFYENVRDALQGKAQLIVSAEDGYRSIRILELALQASDQGHTLPVSY
jgi:predicted dehydrogenase